MTDEQKANGVRPADVPEKFWDKERGELRVGALLKSYCELERRLSQRCARRLEADAAPKLPTLVEAVRAYSQKLDSGASEVGAEYATMMAALARAEAGQ